MGTKKKLTGVGLHGNASHRPQVRAFIPTKLQYDLWSPILSRVDNPGMMVIVIRSITKIYQLYTGGRWPYVLTLSIPCVSLRSFAWKLHWQRILYSLKKNIFKFKISVSHVKLVMQKR